MLKQRQLAKAMKLKALRPETTKDALAEHTTVWLVTCVNKTLNRPTVQELKTTLPSLVTFTKVVKVIDYFPEAFCSWN